MLETSTKQLYKFHNNVLLCYVHRPVHYSYGIWDQLRIDGGSDLTLISKIQESYSEF